MMDAYSEMEAPCESEVKHILYTHARKTYDAAVIDDTGLNQVIESVLERFGGVGRLGSMSGWLMCTRAVLERNVILHIDYIQQQTSNRPREVEKNPLYAYALNTFVN